MTTGCYDFDSRTRTWNLSPIFFFGLYEKMIDWVVSQNLLVRWEDGSIFSDRQYGGGGFIGRAPFQETDTSIDGYDACLWACLDIYRLLASAVLLLCKACTYRSYGCAVGLLCHLRGTLRRHLRVQY